MYSNRIGNHPTTVQADWSPRRDSSEDNGQEVSNSRPYVRIATTDTTATAATTTQSNAQRTALANELRRAHDAVLALQWRPVDEKTTFLHQLKESSVLEKTSCSELVDLLLSETLKGPNGNAYLRVLAGTLGQWADHYEKGSSDPASVDTENLPSPPHSTLHDDASSVQPKDQASRGTAFDPAARVVQASTAVDDPSSRAEVDEANSAMRTSALPGPRRTPQLMGWIYDQLLRSPTRMSVTRLHEEALRQPFSAKVPREIHAFGQCVTKVRDWYITGGSDRARQRVMNYIQYAMEKNEDRKGFLISASKKTTDLHLHPSILKSLFDAAKDEVSKGSTVDSLSPDILMARMNEADRQAVETFFTKDEHHLESTQRRQLPPSANLPHWATTDAGGNGTTIGDAAASSSPESQPVHPSPQVLASKRKWSEVDEKPTADLLQKSFEAFALSRALPADSQPDTNTLAEPPDPNHAWYLTLPSEQQPISMVPGSRHFTTASVPEHVLRQGMPSQTSTVSTQTEPPDLPPVPEWAAVPDMAPPAATVSATRSEFNPLLQQPEHMEESVGTPPMR